MIGKNRDVLTKIITCSLITVFIIQILTFLLSFGLGVLNISSEVFLINIVFAVLGFGLLMLILRNKEYSFSFTQLIFVTGLFSIFSVILLDLFYFAKTGSFFELSAIDSLQYDNEAKEMASWKFIEGVRQYFTNGKPSDDFGAVFITSIAYRIYPSTLLFNFLNILGGLITVAAIFRMGLSYMARNYAFLAALTYALSSFVVYLYSTGMKETFFVMFIVLCFEQVDLYWKKKATINLVLALILLGVIYFFRPAVLAMLLLGLLLGVLYSRKRDSWTYLILGSFVIAVIIYVPKLILISQIATASFNPEVVGQKQNLSPSTFNYLASFLSSAIGPLPTFHPLIGREQQSFYSAGLTFRAMIAIPFWLGVFEILKRRIGPLIAMLSFTMIEMLSLALILESFELRLNSPHLPFIYIGAFYFISKIDEGELLKKRYQKIINLSLIALPILILIWNLRF